MRKTHKTAGKAGVRMTDLMAAGIIVVLMLGYIPLSTLCLEDLRVEYSLRLLQYESDEKEATEPRQVNVLRLDERGAFLISGLALEKRYTAIRMDLPGPRARKLVLEGEIEGHPEQLWIRAYGPTRRALIHPLYLGGLEEGDWVPTDSGDLALWQKGGDLTDMASFLGRIADGEGPVGLAGLDAGEAMAIALAGEGGPKMREQLAMPLRGPHRFRLIVTGDLDLEISKRDLNIYEGRDDVIVKLYRGDELIRAELMEDDGEAGAAAVSSITQSITISLRDPAPGLYRLEIGSSAGGKDYVITGLKTDAPRMVVTDRLYIYDPTDAIYEDPSAVEQVACYIHSPGGNFACSTWHPRVSRSVQVEGGPRIELPQQEGSTQVKGTLLLQAGVIKAELGMPGSMVLEMSGAGFSFLREALFDPNLIMLQPLWSSTVDNYPHILTRGYLAPEETPRGWRFRWEVELATLGSEGTGLKLVLDKVGGDLSLTEMQIKME